MLLLVTAALVTGKNVAIASSPEALGGIGPWLRNGAAIAVVAVLVVLAVRPGDRLLAAGGPRGGPTLVWLAGLVALGLAVLTLIAADRPVWASILTGATILVLGGLWRTTSGRRSGVVAWSVTPACLVVLAVAVIRVFRPEPELDLLLMGTVALGTGALEEIAFRGGLYSLALRTRDRAIRLLVPGIAFGAWHIMDAVEDARGQSWGPELVAPFVIGTVAVTALASWLILEPLRLRSRSVIGPALLHGAVNSGLIALGLRL